MIELPISIKLLQILRENQTEEFTEEEIAKSLKEDQNYVNKALEELVKRGLIEKQTGVYNYLLNNRSEELYKKMVQLYEIVNRKQSEKLLIRGLLCEGPLHMDGLLEILEIEGFNREEIMTILRKDIKEGYIKKIGFSELKHLYFNYSFFRDLIKKEELADYKKVGSILEHQGQKVQGENYLMGSYPPELTNSAREYVNREHKELKRKLLFKSLYLQFISLYSQLRSRD